MREIPRGLDAIVAALAKDDIFVAVGTSGAIYPTAVYVGLAGDFGHRTVETCGIE